MEAGILIKVVLPLSLFIIMLGMGLSLTMDDFKRVLRYPKAVCVGISCQIILLPAVAFLAIKIFNPSIELSMGLIILAFCPGGTTSNLISYLAKADLALSVTLTVIVSILSPFTIPFFTKISFELLTGTGKVIELPFLKTFITLSAITFIPVAIGMLVNKKVPKFAEKCSSPIKVLSIVFLFIIIAGIMKQNWINLPRFFREIGPASLFLNSITMVLGFSIAKMFQLSHKQSQAIGIEVGIQNGTTALLVTSTILENPEMSVAPSIYSILMFFTGALFAITTNKMSSVKLQAA
jgi:bile acid:Na+ symporter, BASS family